MKPQKRERWRHHPFFRAAFASARVELDWVSESGLGYVAVMTEPGRTAGPDAADRELVALGSADDVLQVLVHAVEHGQLEGPFDEVEVPVAAVAQLPESVKVALGFTPEHGGWNYLYMDRPLAVPDVSDEIVRVPPGPEIAREVRALLDVEFPEAWTPVDSPKLVGWWTVRREHELVAVIGATQSKPGATPWLCSLAVSRKARGGGLGSGLLLTAGNECLTLPMAGSPMVSLGVYASNPRARDLYVRLGWNLGAEFASW